MAITYFQSYIYISINIHTTVPLFSLHSHLALQCFPIVTKFFIKIKKEKPDGGGAGLYSQDSGGRGRWIYMSLLTGWSSRASVKSGSKSTENPCLKRKKIK